jgi:hypothetical protein
MFYFILKLAIDWINKDARLIYMWNWYIPGAAQRSRTWSPAEIPRAITAAPEAASIPYIWKPSQAKVNKTDCY